MFRTVTVIVVELPSKVVTGLVIVVVLVVVSSCILVVKDIALYDEYDVFSVLLVTLVVLVATSVTFPNVFSVTEADVLCCATCMHPDDDELLPSQLLSAI